VIKMLVEAKRELEGDVEAEKDECFCRLKGRKQVSYVEIG